MLTWHGLRVLSFLVIVSLCLAIPLATVRHALKEKPAEDKNVTTCITEHLLEEGGDYLEDDAAQEISEVLYKESKTQGIDYRLVLALMKIESNFQHNAVSPKGARGLLQVKPSSAKLIARDLGIEWTGHKTLDEPDKNIRIGIRVLAQLLDDFQNLDLALSAYNIGPSRVRESLRDDVKPAKGFHKLVMAQYRKNLSTLPNP